MPLGKAGQQFPHYWQQIEKNMRGWRRRRYERAGLQERPAWVALGISVDREEPIVLLPADGGQKPIGVGLPTPPFMRAVMRRGLGKSTAIEMVGRAATPRRRRHVASVISRLLHEHGVHWLPIAFIFADLNN